MPAARGQLVVGFGVAALALTCAYLNYTAYFVTYPDWLPHHNYPLHRELSRTIDQLSRDREVYLKYLPYWIDGDVIRLQLRNTPSDWDNIQPELDLAVLARQTGTGFAVILHPQDEETLEGLSSHFLRATWFSMRMPSGEVAFRVFLSGPNGPGPSGLEGSRDAGNPRRKLA
jgi:hypothetical protein